MGYDLLGAALFVMITPLVILGFVAFWFVNARDRAELEGRWRAYAEARAIEYVPATGEWPNRTSPAIRWTLEGAELRLWTIGREASRRTRLAVRPRGALLGSLRATTEGAAPGTFAIRERPAGFSRRILTPEVTRTLLGFSQHDVVTVHHRRGCLVFEWPGGELNDARLDEARRAGEAIARALASEFTAPSRRAA
ncbi:MAG: hypothetical protein KF819_00925 [Labilithrix sp.]|nr:hypothetical protein [Labilithrix sp.]